MLVSRRNDASVLEHQNHGSPRRARPVQHALGHNKTLTRCEFHQAAFKIDEQLSFYHVEKLIVIVMFVPVILALDTPTRTTESFTLQSVWLYHLCGAESERAFSSMISRG